MLRQQGRRMHTEPVGRVAVTGGADGELTLQGTRTVRAGRGAETSARSRGRRPPVRRRWCGTGPAARGLGAGSSRSRRRTGADAAGSTPTRGGSSAAQGSPPERAGRTVPGRPSPFPRRLAPAGPAGRRRPLRGGRCRRRAHAPGPVGDRESADSLGAGLGESAPEAGDPRVRFSIEGVHSDASPAGVGDSALHGRPQLVGYGGTEYRVHIDPRAELRTAAGRSVDTLGHQGQARDVKREAEDVNRRRGAIEA